MLGMTHTEAGAQLAQHWELPDDLTECIRFHHAPHLASEDFRRVVSLINVAEVAARVHRNDPDPNAIEFEECEESLAFLKFSQDQVRDVFATVPKPEASDSLW
jgi:HD-like signal output (HDOD) protein